MNAVQERSVCSIEARKLYREGVELLQQEDYSAAGATISRAAQMGDSTAQCHLGFLYESGFFGEVNDSEAVRWYRKAADQRLSHGWFRLGACYQFGRGVKQDWEEAARLYHLAADVGHTDAARCLAELRELAADARRGSEPAPVPLSMPPVPACLDDPSVRDAVAAYQALAIQNNAPAQLKLGLAYHVGRSAPLNPKLACFWVMRAMLAGDYSAAGYLEYCTRALPPEEHGALQAKIFTWVPGRPVPQL